MMKLYPLASLALLTLPLVGHADDQTHWGLGIGAGYSSSVYKGKDNDYSALPLIYFDNSWLHVSGTTLDIKASNSDALDITLRAKVALGDGYDSSDSSRLRGMDDRDGGVWVGPHMAYHVGQSTLDLDVLANASGNSDGWQSNASLEYDIPMSERLSVTPSVHLSYLNSDYVNYYYGVKSSEARADRPRYSADASWTYGAEVNVGFFLTQHQKLNFSTGVDAVGDEIKDSPIVDGSTSTHASLSYFYLF